MAKKIPGRTGQQCAQRWRHKVRRQSAEAVEVGSRKISNTLCILRTRSHMPPLMAMNHMYEGAKAVVALDRPDEMQAISKAEGRTLANSMG